MDDLGALLRREQREALARILTLLKFTEAQVAAAAAYATGMTTERAAKIARVSPRQFQRFLEKIPAPYKEFFSGTPKKRQERTKRYTAEQQASLMAEMRRLVADHAGEAAEARHQDENDPFSSYVNI